MNTDNPVLARQPSHHLCLVETSGCFEMSEVDPLNALVFGIVLEHLQVSSLGMTMQAGYGGIP